jgi:hypothetical protein
LPIRAAPLGESESVNKNHSFARFSLALGSLQLQFGAGRRHIRAATWRKTMPSRKKAAPKKKAGKPAAKKAAKKSAKKAAAPARKPPSAAPVAARPAPAGQAARPAQVAGQIGSSQPRPAAAAAARPMSAGQVATAQQAEERRKAATRKLFARIRSLEAIVGADLRKRGSLLLSQAVDQWYAEATSATASDVSITNAARAVISQL